MAFFGLRPEDVQKPPFEVWPSNWPAVEFFIGVGTQWRVGMAGPTGLDYTAVLAVMARMRLSEQQHDELFRDLQVMEAAALDAMHSKASE